MYQAFILTFRASKHICIPWKGGHVMLGLVVVIISLLIIIDIIVIISHEHNLTDIVLKVSTNHGPELTSQRGFAS